MYLLFQWPDITRTSDTQVSWISVVHPKAVDRTIKDFLYIWLFWKILNTFIIFRNFLAFGSLPGKYPSKSYIHLAVPIEGPNESGLNHIGNKPQNTCISFTAYQLDILLIIRLQITLRIKINIRVDAIPFMHFTEGALIQGQPSTHCLDINLNTGIINGICHVCWVTTAIHLWAGKKYFYELLWHMSMPGCVCVCAPAKAQEWGTRDNNYVVDLSSDRHQLHA